MSVYNCHWMEDYMSYNNGVKNEIICHPSSRLWIPPVEGSILYYSYKCMIVTGRLCRSIFAHKNDNLPQPEQADYETLEDFETFL